MAPSSTQVSRFVASPVTAPACSEEMASSSLTPSAPSDPKLLPPSLLLVSPVRSPARCSGDVAAARSGRGRQPMRQRFAKKEIFFTAPVFTWSFDVRKECSYQEYFYLLPAETTGMKDDSLLHNRVMINIIREYRKVLSGRRQRDILISPACGEGSRRVTSGIQFVELAHVEYLSCGISVLPAQRSFDVRKECSYQEYFYLLPAETTGMKDDSLLHNRVMINIIREYRKVLSGRRPKVKGASSAVNSMSSEMGVDQSSSDDGSWNYFRPR
ncbi:hypothetical protein GUJ93_ZPchr0013g37447 [Zizania palustris]|uniref:Uncharacterized protein n=1 Tax=Zizania palustris TaxID=103762 RepID=A0A8J5WU37_ZIZPA|nr:hypothetical protein GUJ93_ZPchr0013g37447 [Zizania palustris]